MSDVSEEELQMEIFNPTEQVPSNDAMISVDYPFQGGQVVSWDDDLEYGSAKRPKLLVAIKSGVDVSPDVQVKLAPVIMDEMEKFEQSGAATVIKNDSEQMAVTFDEGKAIQCIVPVISQQSPVKAQQLPVEEVTATKDGTVSVSRPLIKREVTVETDYEIETSQPEEIPAGESEEGYMFTRKKTLKMTTKEITTTVKQEIKTEMEFVHVDTEDELPPRLGLDKEEPDRVGVSVTSMYNIEDEKYKQSEDKVALVQCLEHEMQQTNENICRSVEDLIFDER